MSRARMEYFEKEDVLHMAISDEPEASSGKELVLEQLPGLRRARRQAHVSDD